MEHIKDMNASESFIAAFMEGFDYRQIKQHHKKPTRDSFALAPEIVEKAQVSSYANRLNSSVTALDTFGPSNNVFSFAEGQVDTGGIKDPTFEQTIDLGEAEVAEHLKDGSSGLSFYS